MKKTQGFILMEAITMSVLFIITFGFIYVGINNYIVREKQKSYYDDVATIYQAYYVKEALAAYSNLETLKESLFTNANYKGCVNTYGCIIGSGLNGLFGADTQFDNTVASLNLHQIFFTNDINNLKSCSRNISLDEKCKNTYLDEELRAFINTININNETTQDLSSKHFLIVLFKRDANGKSCYGEDCFSHYTWVPL